MTRGPATVARHPASGFAFANGGRAFRHRNYRLFFAGQLVSLVGTWMQAVAQAWLVLQLTHDPLVLGIVAALAFLPVLVLGLFGGLDRRCAAQAPHADGNPDRPDGPGLRAVRARVHGPRAGVAGPGPGDAARDHERRGHADPPGVHRRGRRPRGPCERGRPQLRDLQRRPDRRTGDRRPHDRVLRRRYQHRVPDQRDQLPRDHLRVCRDAGLGAELPAPDQQAEVGRRGSDVRGGRPALCSADGDRPARDADRRDRVHLRDELHRDDPGAGGPGPAHGRHGLWLPDGGDRDRVPGRRPHDRVLRSLAPRVRATRRDHPRGRAHRGCPRRWLRRDVRRHAVRGLRSDRDGRDGEHDHPAGRAGPSQGARDQRLHDPVRGLDPRWAAC